MKYIQIPDTITWFLLIVGAVISTIDGDKASATSCAVGALLLCSIMRRRS